MKKINESKVKRYIKFDKYLENIRLSGLEAQIKHDFCIPDTGFTSTNEVESWYQEHVNKDRNTSDSWYQRLYQILKEAGMAKEETRRRFLPQLEIKLLMGITGFDVHYLASMKGRADPTYLRDKKITQLSTLTDPKTGKKIKTKRIIEYYQPDQVARESLSQKEYDEWVDEGSIDSGSAVSKIVSRHKKRFS